VCHGFADVWHRTGSRCRAHTRERIIGKNKCAPPFTEAEFETRWGRAIDATRELLDLGIARPARRIGTRLPRNPTAGRRQGRLTSTRRWAPSPLLEGRVIRGTRFSPGQARARSRASQFWYTTPSLRNDDAQSLGEGRDAQGLVGRPELHG